jgi:hypothetical protein
VQPGLRAARANVIDPDRDEGATASHALSVKIRAVFRYPACVSDPTRPPTAPSTTPPVTAPAAVETSQPAATTGPTRDRQETEARQKTAGPADNGSDASSLPGVPGSIRGTLLDISVIDVIHNDADVGRGDAVFFEGIHCGHRGIVRVIQSGCYLAHRAILN